MAMGRQGGCQGDLVVAWSEMPRSPGHVFYDRLQEVLIGAGFDGYVEAICAPYYAQRNGLRWLRFFGQSGDPVKVYSVCRSCRQNAFESISFPLLLRLWGCGQGA